VFAGYVYEIDEGFAKLFTRKVVEKLLNKPVNYKPYGNNSNKNLESISYNIFEREWTRLNPGYKEGFNDWFKQVLKITKKEMYK
jgi:spore germination protein YaaH